MDTASIARDFVVEKGPIYHHSFSVPSIFDQQRCEFAPHSPHADLKEVLRDCAQTRKVTWNIDNCTWDDVFHELQAAEDEYNRRGVKNPVRRLMRAAGEHAADISRWFDLFPSESGGSMVSGGLKLVFSLVKHQVEIRNKILVAFSEILETVAYTRLTRELFRTDSRAMTCARALYEAVLRTITDLILMLNGSQTSKSNARHLLSKVTKPLKRSDEVDRLLEDMNSKGRQYQNCLAIAQMERDKRIDTTTRAALSEIQSTRETVTDTRGGVMAVNDKVNQIHARLGEMQDMFQPTQITLGCSAQNALLNTALDILHEVRALAPPATVTPLSTLHGQSLVSFLPGKMLLDAMDVPHLAALSDLEYLLQQGCLFSNASQGQAQAQQLMHQPRFHDWLSSSRPDLLLVHGNFDACARITPLSYLCAHLSLGLSNTKGLTVLSFFCGQHESRVDSLRGPRGLLRSLITQLLYVGGSFNHDFINTRHYAESIKAHVVQDLCTTFKFLISQLPLNQRVFCFIENILWLESEEWMQDLRDVLEMLYRLAHDSSLRPILKILITSGTARCGLERGIHPQDQVHLIPGGLHGNIEISEQTVTGDLQSRIDSRVSGSTQSWQMVGDFSDESEEEGDYFLLD